MSKKPLTLLASRVVRSIVVDMLSNKANGASLGARVIIIKTFVGK